MSDRVPKINELLRQELGKIILREVEMPTNCLATITRVETLSDLKEATAYFTVLPKERSGEILNIFKKNSSIIQHRLIKTLSMHYIPKVYFKVDNEIEKIIEADKKAAQVDEIFKQIEKEKLM